MAALSLISLWVLILALRSRAAAIALPVVDIGTSIHQASFNETGQYFNFSNIAYGEPPLGNLRFKRSVAPLTPNRTVNDGSVERICPQATPLWETTSIPPVPRNPNAPPPPSGPPPGPPPAAPTGRDPRESEDCLLLDVMVPQTVFEAASKNPTTPKLAPVLLWIHGGGFAQGSKSSAGDPAGLIAKGLSDGRTGFVYVQINYRVGLFGFPPKGPQDTDVDTNAAFYDQQLALQWVQTNIHLFGGDPAQVTVMGESAGASSIMQQITAFGKTSTTLFKRAILQSPAMRPGSDAALYAQVLQQFLAASNLSSVSKARQLTTDQVQSLNRATVGAAPFGSFTYGPNIDADFSPAAPTQLLAQKKFASNVEIIVAHNSNEGILFTDSTAQNQTAIMANLQGLMPSISPAVISNIVTNLYPDDLSGRYIYKTETDRLALILSEALVECNANALSLAFGPSSSGYQFSVFPGIHAEDVGYTFFNGVTAPDFFGNIVDPGLAGVLQNIEVNFVLTGNRNLLALAPRRNGSSAAAASSSTFLSLDVNNNITIIQDPGADPRCMFWQQSLYMGQSAVTSPAATSAAPRKRGPFSLFSL